MLLKNVSSFIMLLGVIVIKLQNSRNAFTCWIVFAGKREKSNGKYVNPVEGFIGYRDIVKMVAAFNSMSLY